MAKKTRYIQVQEIKNAYEIIILSNEVHQKFLEEIEAVLDMLFFQTRAHIQIDCRKIEYFPLPFLTKLLQLARDLRLKKRVLVIRGLDLPSYRYFSRYGLLRLILSNEETRRNSFGTTRE
ncbi:MAG: hypothetical protein MUF77_02745 [Leptospira sp.]|jgi:hypothetical protein|nr:hypothetical protein [Leptospira sp.]